MINRRSHLRTAGVMLGLVRETPDTPVVTKAPRSLQLLWMGCLVVVIVVAALIF